MQEITSHPARSSNALWTVAYCSRMTTPLSDDELASLAIHADARNQTLGVVGVLLVAGGRFLQVLEGERGPVRWLYGQIADDLRHRRVTKLMDMPIQSCAFSGWSMRLIFDTDIAEESRALVLQSLESAAIFDDETRVRSSRLERLRASPAALVSAVLGRGGRSDQWAQA